MSPFVVSGRFGNGYGNRHSGPSFVRAADAYLASQQGRSFAHPQEADGFGVGDFVLGNAASVVLYFKNQAAFIFTEFHLHTRGFGMAGNVRKSLLENAKENGVQVLVQNGPLQ